ncbi:MAG: ribosomal protein L13e, partial [Candidatus Njordarchaeota archaeon]
LVKGEGLSFGEVLAAGISIETARKYGIPLDHRRKTKYDFNVSLLKDVLQKFSIVYYYLAML